MDGCIKISDLHVTIFKSDFLFKNERNYEEYFLLTSSLRVYGNLCLRK